MPGFTCDISISYEFSVHARSTELCGEIVVDLKFTLIHAHFKMTNSL